MCDASKALAHIDELIRMLKAGTYKSDYEERMVSIALAARDSIEPRPTEKVTLTFAVDVQAAKGHYEMHIASLEGVGMQQMLTELISHAYERCYQHSVEVIEHD